MSFETTQWLLAWGMRLFAAIELPLPAVERLSALRLRLSSPGDGLRWTSPDQWHITLHFLGDLEGAEAKRSQEDFSAMMLPAAEVHLVSLGRFVTKGILFAEVERAESLLTLHRAFHERLRRKHPAPAASLPFHPHVTLARSKGRPGLKTRERMAAPALPPFGPVVHWEVRQIHLYASTLGPGGAEYHRLASTIPDAEPAEHQS